MARDAKGVHQYTELDSETTFSEYMNLGQESVSEALKYFSGTSAQRAALTPAPKGALWQDTDGTEGLYSVDPTGNWRQHEGYFTLPPAAWATAVANIVGRTKTHDLPIVLAPNESIMATPTDPSGNGYTHTVLNNFTRHADRVTLTLHQFQVAGSAQQPISMVWRIVKRGAF